MTCLSKGFKHSTFVIGILEKAVNKHLSTPFIAALQRFFAFTVDSRLRMALTAISLPIIPTQPTLRDIIPSCDYRFHLLHLSQPNLRLQSLSFDADLRRSRI